MWNPFKKSKEKKREEVYNMFLYCNLKIWDISTIHYLTNKEKSDKIYKIYFEFAGYIYDKYGQEYLDFFDEKIYEHCLFGKNILENIHKTKDKNI